jgi:hypothetical protein
MPFQGWNSKAFQRGTPNLPREMTLSISPVADAFSAYYPPELLAVKSISPLPNRHS